MSPFRSSRQGQQRAETRPSTPPGRPTARNRLLDHRIAAVDHVARAGDGQGQGLVSKNVGVARVGEADDHIVGLQAGKVFR